MEIPGIISVKPEQTELIEQLGDMVGRSFLEEMWVYEWFVALDKLATSYNRKLELSQAMLRSDFTLGARYGSVFTLEDLAAGAGCYRASELGGKAWGEIEEESMKHLAETVFTEKEKEALFERGLELMPITDITWVIAEADGRDFMHFYAFGVDTEKRGTGAFRRLMEPILDFSDDQGIPCYLECYSDKTEGVYSHFGFKTVNVLSDPAFPITCRCMVREPQEPKPKTALEGL